MADHTGHHKLAGAIGGLTRAALKTNEDYRKQQAAEGRMRRFLEMVPAEITNPIERQRSAELLQRAHMSRIAKKSADLRRKPAKKAA